MITNLILAIATPFILTGPIEPIQTASILEIPQTEINQYCSETITNTQPVNCNQDGCEQIIGGLGYLLTNFSKIYQQHLLLNKIESNLIQGRLNPNWNSDIYTNFTEAVNLYCELADTTQNELTHLEAVYNGLIKQGKLIYKDDEPIGLEDIAEFTEFKAILEIMRKEFKSYQEVCQILQGKVEDLKPHFNP